MTAIDEPPAGPLDDERLDLRHPPKLPPMPKPERFSQTLLSNADRCKRSAYLYVKHHGGMPSHPMDRGSAYHITKARCLAVMLSQNEPRIPPDVAKVLLDEVLAEHPEFTIPIAEQDKLREMIYHFAVGHTIDPEAIVAVERKFLLELPGGYTLSGIIDEAEIHGETAKIRDDKTQWALPPENEYASSFQCRFYAVLLTFGRPISEHRQSDPRTGEELPKRVEIEPCLGDRLTWVDVGEQYPRYLHDGEMAVRSVGLTRLEIEEARRDLIRMCEQLDHAFTTGEWPAVPGSHCSICPCEPECPLPRELRQFAGAINTLEEAQEAAMWVEKWDPRLKATRKELKLWGKLNGAFRFGRDREYAFVPQTSRSTDYEGLNAAVEMARTYGTPFDASEFRKTRIHTRFVAKTVGREPDIEEE